MQKKAIFSRIIAVGLLFLVFNLVKTMIQTYTASQRVGELDVKVAHLEEEFEEVLAEKTYKETSEFVEAEARNRLQLIKPGESVVVIETKDDALGTHVEESENSTPIVDQWINLVFFGLRI